MIDNMLVIIQRDGACTVYVNDLHLIAKVTPRKQFTSGTPILDSDIVDIKKAKFDGVSIPCECGVFVLLSHGWRKAVFYDFSPLSPPFTQRSYSICSVLGHMLNCLLYFCHFSIPPDVYNNLMKQNWFPFIGLPIGLTKSIVEYARRGGDISKYLPDIRKFIEGSFTENLERWKNNSFISSDMEFIHRAFEHFKNEDYLSCISVIIPRIEGILRRISLSSNESFKQKNLSIILEKRFKEEYQHISRLLPENFSKYLDDVYFADFDPHNPKDVSRNTVAHGVVPASKLDLKSCCAAFLIVEQIYCNTIPYKYNEHDENWQ